MQMASPSLSNSTKATKAVGGIREEEQRREHQILQDLDLKDSLTERGIWVGRIVDLDLLFQIPQKDARIIGGIERE